MMADPNIKTIGITGARGMLGWHIASFLRTLPNIRILPVGRELFESRERLKEFSRRCDVIIHCAGMNRGDERVVAETNVGLVKDLIAALERSSSVPHVLFTSSTHIERDTLYGVSKRESAVLFREWAARAGGRFTNLVFPNVFGESGKPHYNSVVSTFCHQVAIGEQATINQDVQLEQIHAQHVARVIESCLGHSTDDDIRVLGRKILVSELLTKIQDFHASYMQQIIPDLREDFDRDLFNTYRSYLYPDHYPVRLKLHADARGSLFESVKTRNGGQTFLSTTKPGITRGNHYHTRKVERFLVVSGQAEIHLRRVLTDEKQVFGVSGDSPAYVDIPTLYTHNITNTGSSELVTLFWTHEFFDPEQADTFAEQV
jgi:UDP-2-acetamido-2,6-beta-L-arabino-hexul-4-ose reductase